LAELQQYFNIIYLDKKNRDLRPVFSFILDTVQE